MNTFLDGLFRIGTYILVLPGLFWLCNVSRRPHVYCSTRLLVGTLLIGLGLFNLIEGIVDHLISKIHHVNETVPPDQWI